MTRRIVPTDYPTIQAAVDDAASGDLIFVLDTYAGPEHVGVDVDNLYVKAHPSVQGISLQFEALVTRITLFGSADIDVAGNALDNVISGNKGDNVLDGGAGRDHYYGSAGDDVFVGGGGADGDVVDYSREAAQGGRHGIVVNQSGHAFHGKVAPDTVIDCFGNTDSIAGIRNIIGSAYADKIIGGRHENELAGGGGADTIVGGWSADTLTGGDGADRFRYVSVRDSLRYGHDVITDFSSAEHDKIDLKRVDADINAPGNQAFTFIGKSGFSGHAGEVGYEVRPHGVTVVADVDGDGGTDFAIALDGVSHLSATDFLL